MVDRCYSEVGCCVDPLGKAEGVTDPALRDILMALSHYEA